MPTMVPYGADQTVYLVIERVSRPGGVCYETEIERTDVETIVADLTGWRFSDPVRVIAFNTLEHWSQDISREIAAEIQCRCDIEGSYVPECVREFVAHHIGSASSDIRNFQ